MLIIILNSYYYYVRAKIPNCPIVLPKCLLFPKTRTTPKRRPLDNADIHCPVVPASHSSNHLVTVRIGQAIGPAQLSGFLRQT